MPKVTFPDKKQKIFNDNTDCLEIAESISKEFAKKCVAVCLDNKILDLSTIISKNANIRFVTKQDPDALEIMRHTAAHIMAQAILNIFPNAKLTIGPVIKEGFYYDIDIEAISEDSFPKIEAEMKKIINAKLPITREVVSKEYALELYKHEPYKKEMISELKDKTISLYRQGNFVDLCRGPHLPNTSFVKCIKLLRVSGAYWRADQSKAQLQRLYGTAFFDKKELKSYLLFLEEAKKRNHRKISIDMDLISFHNDALGMPLFHPKGITLWNTILDYWRTEHQEANYLEVKTPIILRRNLWEKSGHWENYKHNMYTTLVDNQDYAIKPMNCPGSMLFYSTRPRSYRELPMKVAEIGLVHRHELTGVLNGLFRVRAFHQDDAHIFMSNDQISKEVSNLLRLEEKMYSTFGLKFEIELSTQPKKFIGTEKQWITTTDALKLALEKYGQKYQIKSGDGAFYGPKIDLHVKDSLNRTWQCGTIQLDMSLPERFHLSYIGKNNKKITPIVLHRTVFGSIERFLGILIEHYAGKFPLWLSPIQATILPVNDSLNSHSEELAKKIKIEGIKVEVNTKKDRLSKKIRTAQISKIPLILTYGNKEHESGNISVRTLNGKITKDISIPNFIKTVTKHIEEKRLNLNIF